jgi:hypothetical protein
MSLTAARNNAEIDDLFRIIRQPASHGVGIATSRTRWTSSKELLTA